MSKKVFFLAFVLSLLFAVLSLFVAGLLELQIAYASPYTSINVDTAYDMITNGSYPDLVVLDVRTKSEYDSGHIYCTIWIPVNELETRISELTNHEDDDIIVYCGSGTRSKTASSILDSHNFTKVYNMLGGITAWQYAGYPVWIATVHNTNTTLNYDTIQAAIDAPQTLDRHTILVDGGIYYENVVLNKTVSLIGEDRSTTIIDGNGTGTVIRSNASNVEIKRFTIQNGGDSPNSGIFLTRCVNNTICGSMIRNSAYGIELLESNGSSIIGNTMMNNSWAGIYIHDSNENIIHGNTVANNSIGAWIASPAIASIFYHNNFIDNPIQASDSGSSNWDNDTEGNFWSDYTGKDLDSDGIGDTDIPHLELDSYPLMHPYGSIRNLNTNLTYLTIQSAISAPETLDTHTIFAETGTYSEHVIVNKTVSLVGENKSTTIIDGNGTGNVVLVEGVDGVTVTGFTVRNGSNGFYLLGFNHTIVGNTVSNNTNHGIDLVGGNSCINENTITNNGVGIILGGSSYNIVSQNIITNNQGGINLCEDCEDNDISENTLIKNTMGIGLAGNNNSVIGNTIKENWSGIEINGTSNTIYHNNFINNTCQVCDHGTNSSDIWDNGCEGNYWSNYNGSDLDKDGIGDEYLPWEEVDYYPLMSPYIEGDVNHDAIVNILDVVKVGLAFDSKPGDLNWNPHADLNYDDEINILDIVTVAIHFGETW